MKWERCYTGPYTVIEQIGPVNYRRKRSKKAKPIVVHVDKLKPFLSEQKKQEVHHEVFDKTDSQSSAAENDVAQDACTDTSSTVSCDDRRDTELHIRPRRCIKLPARFRD